MLKSNDNNLKKLYEIRMPREMKFVLELMITVKRKLKIRIMTI